MLSQLILAVGSLMLLLLLKIGVKMIRTYLKFKKVYGNKVVIRCYPILGMVHYMLDSFKKHKHSFHFLIQDIQQNSNAKAILYLSGLFDILILTDNDLIKTFYQEVAGEKKYDYTFNADMIFYDGLLQSTGDLWKNSRKFLNQFFHFKSIADMIDPIKKSAQYFLDDVSNQDEYQKVNIFKSIKNITSMSVQSIFFGEGKHLLRCDNDMLFLEELNDILNSTFAYSQSPYFILKTSFLGPQKATNFLNTAEERSYINRMKSLVSISNEFINKRQKQLEDITDLKNYPAKTFLDIYLKQFIINERTENKDTIEEQHRVITKNLIVKQFFSFFLAGTDSTTLTLSMILYYLSINPDIMIKVIQEIESNTCSFNEITVEQVNKLTYLSNVIKEVLRLHPPVLFTIPREVSQTINKDGLYLEKGTIVAPRLINSSKFEDYFKFDPNRHNESSRLDTYDFLPFSSGQRNCIGQHFALLEMKIFLFYILKNYDIKSVDNYELRLKQTVLTLPEDPYMIQIKRKKIQEKQI